MVDDFVFIIQETKQEYKAIFSFCKNCKLQGDREDIENNFENKFPTFFQNSVIEYFSMNQLRMRGIKYM